MQVERQVVMHVALDVVWARSRICPTGRSTILGKSAWRGETGGGEMSVCDHQA